MSHSSKWPNLPNEPLMFDFAVKRLIHFNGIRFANSVFETRHIFDA
jgi:hypothetical protein